MIIDCKNTYFTNVYYEKVDWEKSVWKSNGTFFIYFFLYIIMLN